MIILFFSHYCLAFGNVKKKKVLVWFGVFFSMAKVWIKDLVLILQMDADGENKKLRTRSKGTKGELASTLHDPVPRTPWNIIVPVHSP